MEFAGPSAVDYENVHSLNRAFLGLLRRDPETRRCLGAMPAALAERLVSLTDRQSACLATAPFLLMSFRERDARFWEPVFDPAVNRDLFEVPLPASDELGRLIAASLSFVWQLARHNPYAARLVCGASLHWCEQLTERTVLHVLATAGAQKDVLTLRAATNVSLWSKLLDSGVSRDRSIRKAAHMSALQCVLTSAFEPARTRWATAACTVRSPLLRVADDT